MKKHLGEIALVALVVVAKSALKACLELNPTDPYACSRLSNLR